MLFCIRAFIEGSLMLFSRGSYLFASGLELRRPTAQQLLSADVRTALPTNDPVQLGQKRPPGKRRRRWQSLRLYPCKRQQDVHRCRTHVKSSVPAALPSPTTRKLSWSKQMHLLAVRSHDRGYRRGRTRAAHLPRRPRRINDSGHGENRRCPLRHLRQLPSFACRCVELCQVGLG